MDIKLGSLARDRITGFEGIVTARTDWLYGCTRYSVAPRTLDKDGKIAEAQWFDDSQLVVVDEHALDPEHEEAAKARARSSRAGPGGMPGCMVETG